MHGELVPFNSASHNSNLIPVNEHQFSGQTKPAVSAKRLYDFLGFSHSQWTRWAKKNIVNNPYAIENEDYIIFDIVSKSSSERPTDDYAISLALAKKIAMMARTQKGEEARNYFLDCERIAQGQQLPQVSDPALRMLLDQTRAMERIIVDLDQARTEARQAQSMALQAMQAQQYMTIREYVMYNDLVRQLPPGRTQQEFGKYLAGHCRDTGWPLRKMPTENPFTEWAYPVHVITERIHPWLARRNSQLRIDISDDGIWHNDN